MLGHLPVNMPPVAILAAVAVIVDEKVVQTEIFKIIRFILIVTARSIFHEDIFNCLDFFQPSSLVHCGF